MVRNDYTIGPTLNNILVFGLNVSNILETTVGGQFTSHRFDQNNKVWILSDIPNDSITFWRSLKNIEKDFPYWLIVVPCKYSQDWS